jgi:hypothetical protein
MRIYKLRWLYERPRKADAMMLLPSCSSIASAFVCEDAAAMEVLPPCTHRRWFLPGLII